MALVHDSIEDFVLFPRDHPHFEMAHEDSFGSLPFGAHARSDFHQQRYPDTTSYDTYPAVSVYSPTPQVYQNSYQYPLEQTKTQAGPERRLTPAGSPSPSVSQTFDHPPSTLSSASGASVQSTASSAVGSPFSHATHSLPGQGQWAESQHGLGLAPEIVHSDGFGDETMYPLSGLETDIMFDECKLQTSFVGESTDISSSSSGSQPFPSISSCSASRSFIPAIPSPPALDQSVMVRNVTIDTILEEVNNRITSPGHTVSPSSATSAKPSPETLYSANPHSSPRTQSGSFKSPTTPASAMSPPSTSRALPFGQQKRGLRNAHVSPGIERQAKRASVSTPYRFTPYPRPVSQVPQIPSPSLQSHNFFFNQSSGRFIPPLESSCWFSLHVHDHSLPYPLLSTFSPSFPRFIVFQFD